MYSDDILILNQSVFDDLKYNLHSKYILETDRAAWHNGILLNQTFKELVGTAQFLKSCFKRSKPGTWGHLALPQHVFPNDGRGAGMEPYRCHNRAGGGCSLIGSQPHDEGDGYINAGNMARMMATTARAI